MDYAIVHAIKRDPRLLLILLLYDIACQFFVNFRVRLLQHPQFLSLPENIIIKPGVGLFHVHGHIKECHARYAPTFIRGAGMVDGEVVETLWSSLNHTASSARAMSWSHRQEYLDSHMGDSNWKKLTRIGTWYSHTPLMYICELYDILVSTLEKKYKICRDQLADSSEYFERLSSHVGVSNVQLWSKLEDRLQILRMDDITVMDQLDVAEAKGK